MDRYLLPLTTLNRYQPIDSSGKLLFTTTSRDVSIVKYRVSLVNILFLHLVMIRWIQKKVSLMLNTDLRNHIYTLLGNIKPHSEAMPLMPPLTAQLRSLSLCCFSSGIITAKKLSDITARGYQPVPPPGVGTLGWVGWRESGRKGFLTWLCDTISRVVLNLPAEDSLVGPGGSSVPGPVPQHTAREDPVVPRHVRDHIVSLPLEPNTHNKQKYKSDIQ